jgi:hypothetical protein
MWIPIYLEYPKEEGFYRCLVVQDDNGVLVESENEYFDGVDWCHYLSSRQFISYWFKK